MLSEVGEIERFGNAKKLVAFDGLYPSVFSSGKFTATRNRISKRGSKRLRLALFLAVRCGLRLSANKKLKAFYDKKKAEGKGHKVAIIACANKLLHWIFALLNDKTTFVDLA
ncbi:transposase [Cohnella kolymensis]|uniref:transposase n=1 Tax=Cohnella kolymensis TaxID=1590652 RepID=UPI0009E5166F|nr:transposase [Cohnella kolymensis]